MVLFIPDKIYSNLIMFLAKHNALIFSESIKFVAMHTDVIKTENKE